MGDDGNLYEKGKAHPRALELMTADFFWDCVDEAAPFGSDEGNTAYYEWRDWRRKNPRKSLGNCIEWILMGEHLGYNKDLLADDKIRKDIEEPNQAFLSKDWEVFSLDSTIIASCFSQLLDEGRIDQDAQKYLEIALSRQQHPLLNMGADHVQYLQEMVDVASKAYAPVTVPARDDKISKNIKYGSVKSDWTEDINKNRSMEPTSFIERILSVFKK